MWIHLDSALSIIDSNRIGGQCSNALHGVVVDTRVMLALIIQATQKPQATLKAKCFAHTLLTNKDSLENERI